MTPIPLAAPPALPAPALTHARGAPLHAGWAGPLFDLALIGAALIRGMCA